MKQIFRIKDFKVFEDQSITLKNLTILAGCNSVGKSTIIQSLLLSRVCIELHNRYGKDSKGMSVPLNGPFLLELGNTHEIIRRGKRIDESNFELILSENDKVILNLSLLADRSDQNHYNIIILEDNIYGLLKGLLGAKIYYLCAERIGPRLKYEYEMLDYLHAGYRGESTFQVLSGEDVKVNSKMIFTKNTSEILYQQARLWLNYIIPGANFDNAIPIGKSRVIEGTFGQSLPTNVGFGISYVLPIIVNGLLAEPDTIMIVENPEAHLHPSGQSRIGRFLATVSGGGVQVVIETHSEHVINGIRIASLENKIDNNDIVLNFISRNDNKTMIKEIDINEFGDLTSYPKGFFDQEQNDFATIVEHKIKKSEI